MYYVRYRVVGFPPVIGAGPYDTLSEAEYQRDDIAGFEGVFDVYIETRTDKPLFIGKGTGK